MAPPSRAPAEAVEHYRGRTARLLSCLTTVHVVIRAYHVSDVPLKLELARGDAARLHADPRLTLLVTEQYEVRQSTAGWYVEIVGYLYAIGYEDRELVSYHWHPSGKSTITQPHMHVGAAVQIGDRWLGKVHLPTGMVGLEQVIALAIVELGVEPLRDDWERLIAEAAVR
jgi:hypothetical protein